MRFFSNDAKETNDDENSTVPQQRSGSPWSDAPTDNQENSEYAARPAETATAVDEREQVDLPLDEQGTYDRPDVNDSTVTSPDAPVNEPTDAEVAGSDDDPALRDEGDFDEPTAVDPATEQPLDTTDEHTDTVGDTSDTVGETSDTVDEPSDKFDEPTDPGAVPADTTDTLNDDGIDDHSDERENEEVIENAEVSDTLLDAEPVESDGESSTYASAAADDDSVTSDDTVAEDPTPADVAETAPVVAAVPVAAATTETAPAETAPAETAPAAAEEAAKPGSVEEKSVESFFGAEAAKGFQERWRDVQLRFVDSPKDAAAEAAGLVDEAVDQLTASLKGQKDALLSDSDDTEKLRVELRGYRDILNKVLSL